MKIWEAQSLEVANIISELYNGVCFPDTAREEERLFAAEGRDEVEATGFSADVYYETADEIVAIELKSVKPNSGEMRGEKKKILEGKAALKRLHPDKAVKFYVGFPFDPTVEGVEYNKERFCSTVINLRKSFALNEILLAGELWDMLSGESGTMQIRFRDICFADTTTAYPSVDCIPCCALGVRLERLLEAESLFH